MLVLSRLEQRVRCARRGARFAVLGADATVWAIALLTAGLVLTAAPAAAQDSPTTRAAPATAPATTVRGEPLKVTVESVTGAAERRLPGDEDKWAPIKVGDKLDELTIIRTGFRSKVVLKLADRGQVTVNSGTKIGIREFRKRGRLVTMNLGLKYGRLRATVDPTRGPNDAKISTPVATLSVRGTGGDIGYTGDHGLGLRGREGTWRVAAGVRTRDVAPGESTDGDLTSPMTIMKWLRSTRLGDAFGGLTLVEKVAREFNPDSRDPTGSVVSRSSGGTTRADITPPIAPEIIKPPSDHIIIGI